MKKGNLILIICTILILSLCGLLIYNQYGNTKDKDTGTASAMTSSDTKNNNSNLNGDTYNPSSSEYDSNNLNEDGTDMFIEDPSWTPATSMDLDPNSVTVLVNKEYALSKKFVPNNLVIPNVLFDTQGKEERKHLRADAAKAIEGLFAAASSEGHTLYAISGYRSYDRQKQIFTNNIVRQGKEHTLRYSAVPGTSEHQTGLAMDISSKSMRFRLIDAFATSKEGIWLATNAHKYGFIIRYQKDKEDITGYAYEPWHVRYVGVDLAKYLYDTQLTLEEYYKYVPSSSFDFETVYAELINYKLPITPEDLDGDGIPNIKDDDIDGDGIPNGIDDDIDGDGIPNTEDDDMDGDGIPNTEDMDMDGDGILNGEDDDIDGDSIPNTIDDDMDADGLLNGNDRDIDSDGLLNTEDDDMDADGIPNHLDMDMDGDGLLNSEDDDIDGDGIPNTKDDDMDGDGIPNDEDLDMDGDGIPNDEDDDIDGDGIPNTKDKDMDGDGISNGKDDDMNGNGILDFNEHSPQVEAWEKANPPKNSIPPKETTSPNDSDTTENPDPSKESDSDIDSSNESSSHDTGNHQENITTPGSSHEPLVSTPESNNENDNEIDIIVEP